MDDKQAEKTSDLITRSKAMTGDNYLHIKLSPSLMKMDCFYESDWILIGGAITTVSLFEAFELNPAHLGEDGKIRRYHQVIGTVDDIEEDIINLKFVEIPHELEATNDN